MLPRNPADLVKALRQIVDTGVVENRSLDFKEELPGPKDDDKREFLADISSFANSFGGDIVFGVAEGRTDGKRNGVWELRGLGGDIESAKLRLEQMVRDGLAPRLGTVLFDVVADDGFPRGPILVARIGKSWAAPHMMSFRGSSRFFARTGTGKHQMDIDEIRDAFLGAHDALTRVRSFCDQRLERVASGHGAVELESGAPYVAVHVVPLLVSPLAGRDVAGLSDDRRFSSLVADCDRSRWNLEGRLFYAQFPETPARAYVQVSRDGSLEIVDASAVRGSEIPAQDLESKIVGALDHNIAHLRAMDVHEPLVVMISLHGVRGVTLESSARRWGGPTPTLDRDDILLPECVIEGPFEPAQLRHAFDALWRSGGIKGSPSFDADGRWTNPR